MNSSDRAYKAMLEKKISKLQAEINNLTKKQNHFSLTPDLIAEKIDRNQNEIKKIQEELKDYTEKVELGFVSTAVVDGLDVIGEKHDVKKENISQRIAELEELKKQLTTAKAKRKITKKIEHQEKLIKKLQKKDNMISGVQRVVMYPKYHKEIKKKKLLSNQEAKVNVAEANYNDLEKMQQLLRPNESRIDKLKNVVYEIRKERYARKRDHAAEVLNQMQKCKSPIMMRGAAPVVITKKLKNKFSNKLQQDQMMIDMAYNPNQQNAIAIAAK